MKEHQYLGHLYAFSKTNNVCITKDILNDQGVLVLAKGDQLDKARVEKILKHKLIKPIEECVSLDPILTQYSLKKIIQETIRDYSDIAALWEKNNPGTALTACLNYLDKFSILIQKLTVMKKVMPRLFNRSILKSVVILLISNDDDFDKADVFKIFISVLCEDIGYLHLNPKLEFCINPPAELWKEYIAHPFVAATILSRVPNLPSSIIRSVREHHERIDGSGFPSMKDEHKKISKYALLTGLVDEIIQYRDNSQSFRNITIRQAVFLLQFKGHQFSTKYINIMNKLVALVPPEQSHQENVDIKVLAKQQIDLFYQCLLLFDIVARILEATSLSVESKNIRRLRALCQGFANTILSCGMLSSPIVRLLEHCTRSDDISLFSELKDIDLGHWSILNQLEHIFIFLEYTVNQDNECNSSELESAQASLDACFQYYTHLKDLEKTDHGWTELYKEMNQNNLDLEQIINSIRKHTS